KIAESMRNDIIDFIKRFKNKSSCEIKEERYQKFRKISKYGIE
ncbi:hypothetical protein SFB3_325G0, partial [Candidatus Arthromitus sp. SFB-3]